MERLGDIDHEIFKNTLLKVSNTEVIYKAISFYLGHLPLLLPDLLATLKPRLDHARVINIVKNADNLPLIKPYLVASQSLNLQVTNEAYHALLREEEDFRTLRASLQQNDAYDALALAKTLESHELLEFRRIAALLYRQNSKWEESLSISKADRLYADALETAAASKSEDVVYELATYFIGIGNKEAYAALLYVAFDFVKPDVVDELSWRYGLGDLTMPYKLQQQSLHVSKIAALEKELKELKAKAKKDEPEDDSSIIGGGLGGRLMIGGPGQQYGGGVAMNGGMVGQPTGMMGMQPTGW